MASWSERPGVVSILLTAFGSSGHKFSRSSRTTSLFRSSNLLNFPVPATLFSVAL